MTHTKESLEALEPRELDALAHEAVMRERVVWQTINGMRCPYVIVDNPADSPYATIATTVPHYSPSLDAAAVLEAELAERELHDAYLLALTATVHPEYILYSGMTVKQRFEKVTATAKARTIAAILTVQEAA